MSFIVGNVEYLIIGKGLAVLKAIVSPIDHLVVPSEVESHNSKKYKLIDIYRCEGYGHPFTYEKPISMVSFDESSEIDSVPAVFIKMCLKTFYLPQRVKRVAAQNLFLSSNPEIICEKSNKFVCVIGKSGIMNKHPLEIVSMPWNKIRVSIRETVRIISLGAYGGNGCIKYVSIPSSVEIIDDFAFYDCMNLQVVSFKGNSHLKLIGKSAFDGASLRSVIFPSSLEIIGSHAFDCCEKLESIVFPNESKLKIIGNASFMETKIIEVNFPASVVEIKSNAFRFCKELKSISFPKDSKLRKLGKLAFDGCSNLDRNLIPQLDQTQSDNEEYSDSKDASNNYNSESHKCNAY